MILGNKNLMGGKKSPVSFVKVGAAGEASSGTNFTINIPYPTSTTPGNLLVAFVFPYSPTGDISAPGWTWYSSTSDSVLELHFLYKISDGTETGNATFTCTVGAGRIFGIIGEYNGGKRLITSSDVANTRKTSEVDSFDNDSYPNTDKSLYVACIGITNTAFLGSTPGNYTKRFDNLAGLNRIILFDYYVADKTFDDGTITTNTAASFDIFAGIIIE